MLFSKKISRSLFSALFCVIPAFGSNAVKKESIFYRQLLILSDDSEYVAGQSIALSQDFVGALQSAACPMLVSVGLWRNYVEECECLDTASEQEGTPEKFVVDRFNAIEAVLDAPENTIENLGSVDPVVAKNILVDRINAALEKIPNNIGNPKIPGNIIDHMRYYQVPFYDGEWDVYKVNDSFYLFVPVAYKNDCLEEAGQNEKATSIADAVGLAIDTLEKIENPFFDIDWMYFEDDFDECTLCESLNTVFLSSYDGASYVWDIVLSGHGINSEWLQINCPKATKLANMEPSEFGKVLDFFEKNIPMNSFWYTTCYGGGMHMNDFVLSRDSKNRSFTIVCLCLTDTPSYGHMSDVLQPLVEGSLLASDIAYDETTKRWELVFNVKHNWHGFFSDLKVNSFDAYDLSWIWNAAGQVLPAKVENIPLVLCAKSNHAIAVYPDNCLKLSEQYCDYLQRASRSVMLDARNTSFVLLDKSELEIPVMLTTEEAPLLISILPGEALHHLKNITATSSTLDQVAAMFRPLKGTSFDKTFVVDEIMCKPDCKKYGVLSQSNASDTLILKNIVVRYKKDTLVRFFFETADGDLYKMHMACNATCDKAHLRGLKQIKSENAKKSFKKRLQRFTNS